MLGFNHGTQGFPIGNWGFSYEGLGGMVNTGPDGLDDGNVGQIKDENGTITYGPQYQQAVENAIINSFGSQQDIDQRDLQSNFASESGGGYGYVSLSFDNSYSLVVSAYFGNNGRAWFDKDGDGTFETSAQYSSSGVMLDLDFNGSYESSAWFF